MGKGRPWEFSAPKAKPKGKAPGRLNEPDARLCNIIFSSARVVGMLVMLQRVLAMASKGSWVFLLQKIIVIELAGVIMGAQTPIVSPHCRAQKWGLESN